ncbi:translation initiation factor IF-3 [Evansella vedderi]|uniref:Translation initiation factor IF-3 n=1 Tax=Evansella vedderi TaxID=38282 RepID=A0ABT9ZUH8_9BACI|nr:hypothetical protein [Evansella vedderi]MDQ0254893.1 translation initiation factor IF-3 [Evansella vedderi]
MAKQKPKVTVRFIGRKEPSKQALDRFIEKYMEMAAEYERKERRELLESKKTTGINGNKSSDFNNGV